jgi:hypothetical protein
VQRFRSLGAIAERTLAEPGPPVVRSGNHDFAAVHMDAFLVIRKAEQEEARLPRPGEACSVLRLAQTHAEFLSHDFSMHPTEKRMSHLVLFQSVSLSTTPFNLRKVRSIRKTETLGPVASEQVW